MPLRIPPVSVFLFSLRFSAQPIPQPSAFTGESSPGYAPIARQRRNGGLTRLQMDQAKRNDQQALRDMTAFAERVKLPITLLFSEELFRLCSEDSQPPIQGMPLMLFDVLLSSSHFGCGPGV